MINYGSIPGSTLVFLKPEVKPRNTKLEQTELAWAAGLFDGEGSTICCPQSKPNEHLMQFALSVAQAGEQKPEVLERFQNAVMGCGRIYGPYGRLGVKRKPAWSLRTTSFEETQAVIAMLWKYLSTIKRAQAKKALLAYRQYMQESQKAA